MGTPTTPDSSAEASRQRIASAGPRWHRILGVGLLAPLEDVKRAYRLLALLHHPDKGGDLETFRLVQRAYEEGARKRQLARVLPAKRRAGAKAKAKARHARATADAKTKAKATVPKAKEPRAEGETPPKAARRSDPGNLRGSPRRARAKPVPEGASKVKLRNAVEWWQSAKGSEMKTMPDEVPTARPEEVAEWLRAGACVFLDVREPHEATGSVPAVAVSLSYLQLTTAPELAAPQVFQFRRDSSRLVVCSQSAPRMGPCGLVGALLLDVFGLEAGSVLRLEGGHAAWSDWVAAHPESVPQEAPAAGAAAPAAAEPEVSPAVAEARAELALFEAAMADHVRALLEGADEAAVRAHLAALSPLFARLGFETSLRAMLVRATSKPAAARGPFDVMAVSSLEERFERRLRELRALAGAEGGV